MAQSAGIIDSEPRIQKPMLAHFRDGSSEHIDLKDKETCAKPDTEAEPTLWMRGGGVIGDCIDAIVCFECCKGCCDCCC